MRISSLNTGTTAYTYDNAGVLTNRLDKVSNLYQIDLKKINKKDLSAVANEPKLEDALVYARRTIDANKPLSSSAVVLENADGSLFKLDTSNANTKINLVAKGKSIELYVYNPADNTTQQPSSVLKYTFDNNGKMSGNAAVTELKAWEVSDAEIKTKRDLDGNASDANGRAIADRLGGKLAVRTGATSADRASARTEASAGIFKLEVLDQQLFVVGETIEKSKQINASDKTLLNADGSAAWKPDATYDTFRAVKNNNNTWSVYATRTVNSEKEVTKFDFDANRKLTASNVLSAAESNAAEVSSKRDLNVDGFFGAEVSKAIDKTGGLYQAKFQGATMYLAQTGINSDKTGANPISLKSKLLDSQGNTWSGPAAGYTLSAVVKSSVIDAGASAGDVTVFAKNASNSVLKYTFSTSGAGNDQRYKLDSESSSGLTTTAIELAAAEKAAKRDLNGDSAFGVGSIAATDATGGLFKGSMLGTDFYMVGQGLKTASTGSLANDLSQALLAVDGSAWKVKTGYTVATVVQTATIGSNAATKNKYEVYAYKGDASANPVVPVDKTDVLRYEFESDTDGKNVTVTASDIKVTAQYLSEQEKTLARDLNMDSQLGASLTSTALDLQGGLFKATLFGQDYVVKGQSGQSVVDLSQAFLEDDGVTAWKPKAADNTTAIALSGNTFRLVMGDASANSGDATIYVSTGSGATSKYLKFDFEEVQTNGQVTGYKQVGNATVLSAEEMAAAEKANLSKSVDLNGDGSYGVVLTEALDQRGGLFKGSLGDQTNVFFKESPTRAVGSKIASQAQDFSAALTSDTGYWSIDTTGKTVRAYEDGTDYIVLVSDNTDKTKITQYTFDTANNNILTDEQDITLDDLIAAELNGSVNRDLNADGNVGVRVSTAVPDSQGGLFTVSAGGKDHLVVDSAAANISDLSTALRNKDGTAWTSPAGATRLVIDQQGSDYKLYAKTASGVNEYTFDSDYKLKDAQTRTNLDGMAIADAEKAADAGNGRDINGDGFVGARITKTLKNTAGDFLYEAKLGNNTYTVALPAALSGVTTDLTNKALLKADGSIWTAGTMTLVDADISVANGKIDKTVLFMQDGNAGKRLTFGSDGKLLSTDAITGDAINALSDTVKASYMTGSYVDTTGGLYKATVLGSDFYVVGTAGTNANSPTDLSQALMVGSGSAATAWKPDTGYSIGGMVTNASNGYDVYTYKTTAGVTEVKKSSWDSDLNFLGTVGVDAANLVDVEASKGRDLNKDGAFGFSILSDQSTVSNYKGVTATKVGGGSMTFLVAGTNLNPGSALSPIGLKDALLNAEGTAAWTPDSTYNIKSVDDRGNNRVVYAASTANGDYMKYEFSKTTGKLQEPGTRLTAIQMAALELDDPNDATDLTDKDLTADGHVGLGSITSLRVSTNAYAQGKDTGLLKAKIDNNEFLVYSPNWSSGDKIDLNAALLKPDGTAWSVPASFEVQGIYENADDELEVYGYDTGTSKNVMYRFTPGVDSAGNANGAYTLMPSAIAAAATGDNTVTDADLALTEYDANTDLNADGAIGYKANATPEELETGGTQALGKASLGSSEIYFVTTDYADALSDTTGTEVGGGALYMDTTGSGDLVYWNPSTSEANVSYTVKSVVQNGSDVEVWALREDSTDTTTVADNGFVKFTFTQSANKWVLDSSAFVTAVGAPLTYDQIVAHESGVDSVITGNTADAVYTGKDLNGDGFIGLKLESLVSSGMGSAIFKTTIKADDGTNYADTDYYLVGSNLASGTAAQPLGLDAKYVLVDGSGSSTAWAPSGAVTNWKVLDPVTADAEGATHSLEDGGTTVYFMVTSTEAYKV